MSIHLGELNLVFTKLQTPEIMGHVYGSQSLSCEGRDETMQKHANNRKNNRQTNTITYTFHQFSYL